MREYDVTDDSGFLGILDPDAYEGFVGEEWALEGLGSHFEQQMKAYRLLLWGTGAEEVWRIGVSGVIGGGSGFREVSGFIYASRGRLCLINYEALTMAAGLKNLKLPQPHQGHLVMEMSPGCYRCRIVQLEDPEADPSPDVPMDFRIELESALAPGACWTAVPWGDARGL